MIITTLMTPERWQQIEQLLQAALERAPAERAEFIESACGGDAKLREEVDSLLASEHEAKDFLESDAFEDAAVLIEDRDRDEMLNRHIGPYTIEEKLGSGGMGEVYLASDTRLGRKVALKLLPAYFNDGERVRRFQQEARAASALSHPNVATIYEIGEVDDLSYIAMEYVEGRTLSAKIDGKPLISHGITHRDIKPGNIMVTTRGQAKVLDFGLAKFRATKAEELSEVMTAVQTTPGLVLGTVQYMSPEQALGQIIDHRSDIWSFGVVLYEMVTGRRPFSGATPTETIENIRHRQPEAVARFNYGVPDDLERIIRKCLEKDRERRYQSARELFVDLKNLKRDSDSGMIATAQLPRVRSSRSRLILGLASVVALLAISIVAYYSSTKRGTAIGAPQIKSIAVLPFKPLLAEGRDESLELGMADTLIARLSNIREISVRPISAVRKYTALEQDPIAAGREQKVDAVLDGNIQRSGEKIRVTVRLVRVADGREIWSDQFDEKFTDIFSVQDSVSQKVSGVLALTLTGEEQRRLVKRDTTSAEAYQFYLRGRYLQNKRTADGLKKSIQEFQQAIDLDPNYALGYVGLADSYWSFEQIAGLPTRETLPKARAAADRALQIDDSLSEAHASSARIYEQLWRWSEAETEYKRAVSLNPNNPTAHQRFALYLRTRLRFDEAMSEIKRAQELDPLSPGISANAAFAYLLKNDLNAAIEQDKKIIELDPGFWIAHNDMGWAYLKQRRYEEATAEFQNAVDSSGRASLTLGNLGHCYGVTGRRTEALRLAKELEERYAKSEAIGFFIGTVYAGLGDKDQAFAWLEKDFQQRSGQLPFITWWPNFESLRSDPRYADLVRRMGLNP